MSADNRGYQKISSESHGQLLEVARSIIKGVGLVSGSFELGPAVWQWMLISF